VTNQEYADILDWAFTQGYLTTASRSTATAYGQELLDVDSNYCQLNYDEGRVFYVFPETMRNHPVVEVSWYGAAAYCNWLSQSQGLTPCYDTDTWTCDFSKNGYHLPTEAQWERAAAWNGSRRLRYGNGSDSVDCATANFNNCNPLELSNAPYTSPVGHYAGASSPVGCYDMCGNAHEWCNDWSYRVYTESDVTDPEGPVSGSARVLRGGTWGLSGYFCRSANRLEGDPSGADGSFGFRVAR
jgi:formylglycine-generating enzyme required for sulfatase activity